MPRSISAFSEDIDPDEFRAELERSFNEAAPVDVERFVNVAPGAASTISS